MRQLMRCFSRIAPAIAADKGAALIITMTFAMVVIAIAPMKAIPLSANISAKITSQRSIPGTSATGARRIAKLRG